MASIQNSLTKLDVHGSIIDCNWYYGCLFSPKKDIDIHAFPSGTVGINDVHVNGKGKHPSNAENEKNHRSFAEKDARNEKLRFREEGTDLCFGSIDFDAAEICMEDVNNEGECLASMFRVLDEDGDGKISVDEIVRFLERLSLGLPKEEVELAVRSVSDCRDDFLTATEFVEFYRVTFADKEEEVDNMKVEEQTICEAFDVFDQNGDGFISAMELADVLCRLGFVEGRDVNFCQSMIESVDYNGDGFVDIHEFKHLITINTSPTYPCLQCVAAVN